MKLYDNFPNSGDLSLRQSRAKQVGNVLPGVCREHGGSISIVEMMMCSELCGDAENWTETIQSPA